MSRFTDYADNADITFNTFDTWSNNVSSDSNVTIQGALGDWHPTQSAPYAASVMRGATIFYGNVVAGSGGQVSISSPYSVGATSSITVKNFNIAALSLTLVAVQTYPYVFHSWRTAASGGGTQLSTSTSFTVSNNGNADYSTYYAYFV